MTKTHDAWLRRSSSWFHLETGAIVAAGDTSNGYVEGWGMPVWEDTFEGSGGEAPDGSRWYRRGLPGNDYYLSNTDRQGIIQRDNAYLEDNKLVLKTERRATPLTPDSYTRWYDTAYIDTMPRAGFDGFEQRYGRWEARVHSLEPGNSAGIWSAFWLRTNQDGGEVDIFEHVGTPAGRNEDGTPGSYTYANRWPDSGIRSQCVFFEETGRTTNIEGNAYHESRYDLPAPYFGWHVYACEWTPDRISCYCDGVMVGEIRRGERPVNPAGSAPVGPNNNLDDGAKILDGGFGGEAKAHMRVDVHVGFPNVGMASEQHTVSPHYTYFDYVRVWEWDGQE